MHSCWHGFFRTNFINTIVPKNCAYKTCQSFQTLGHGTCIGLLAGSETKRAGHGFYTEQLLHRGALHRGALHGGSFTRRSVYTEKSLHRGAFTHRRVYTGKSLHRGDFAHRILCTQTRSHTEGFTKRQYGARNFYREQLLRSETCTHRGAFIHRSFYTKIFFIHRSFYTQKLLDTEAFTQKKLYTEELLHTDGFTQRSLYTRRRLHTGKLLHTEAFTQSSFTKRNLYSNKP